MKGKQGFTLVELLAVIVVLAIVAVISVPQIFNVIEKTKKNSLRSSAYGLMEAADKYYAKNSVTSDVRFIIQNGKMTSAEKLLYKGSIETGIVILNSNAQLSLCIDDGKYYALKTQEDSDVTIGDGTCIEHATDDEFFDIINSCDFKLQDCQNNVSKLETEIKEKENIISDLKNTIENQGGVVSGIESILKEKENTIKNQENTIANLEKEVEDKTNTISTLEAEINDGKNLISNAIIDRGLQTSPSKTFDELASDIKNISSGPMFYVERVKNNSSIVKDTGYYNSSDYFVHQVEINANGVTNTLNYGTDGADYYFSLNNVYIISENVIVIGYNRQYNMVETTQTNCWNNFSQKTNYYMKTFLYSSGAWKAVATVNLNPTYSTTYYDKNTCDSSGDMTEYTNYSADVYVHELLWQDVSYNNAYFIVEEYRNYTYMNYNGTNSYYLDQHIPNTLTINKSTGAMTLSTSTTVYSNKYFVDTGLYSSTTEYIETNFGYIIATYSDTSHYELTKAVYYNYVGATPKSFTVTGGMLDDNLETFVNGAYQGLSKLKYYIKPKKLEVNFSNKTLTLNYDYANMPTAGYPTADTIVNNVSKTYDISNIIPDGKSLFNNSKKYINCSDLGCLSSNSSYSIKGILLTDTGQYYAIVKLNEGYLYVIGEVIEDITQLPSILNLELTSVRYSPTLTLYDGSNAFSTVVHNNPDHNNYYCLNNYNYKISFSK